MAISKIKLPITEQSLVGAGGTGTAKVYTDNGVFVGYLTTTTSVLLQPGDYIVEVLSGGACVGSFVPVVSPTGVADPGAAIEAVTGEDCNGAPALAVYDDCVLEKLEEILQKLKEGITVEPSEAWQGVFGAAVNDALTSKLQGILTAALESANITVDAVQSGTWAVKLDADSIDGLTTALESTVFTVKGTRADGEVLVTLDSASLEALENVTVTVNTEAGPVEITGSVSVTGSVEVTNFPESTSISNFDDLVSQLTADDATVTVDGEVSVVGWDALVAALTATEISEVTPLCYQKPDGSTFTGYLKADEAGAPVHYIDASTGAQVPAAGVMRCTPNDIRAIQWWEHCRIGENGVTASRWQHSHSGMLGAGALTADDWVSGEATMTTVIPSSTAFEDADWISFEDYVADTFDIGSAESHITYICTYEPLEILVTANTGTDDGYAAALINNEIIFEGNNLFYAVIIPAGMTKVEVRIIDNGSGTLRIDAPNDICFINPEKCSPAARNGWGYYDENGVLTKVTDQLGDEKVIGDLFFEKPCLVDCGCDCNCNGDWS